MEIKYDKDVDTKYILLKKGKVSYTEKKESWLLFDCAKNGEVLGVEILEESRHLISLTTVKGGLFSTSDVILSEGNNKSVELKIDTQPMYGADDLWLNHKQ